MFDNARWLRLTKRTLLVIDGQDFTEEIWMDALGRTTVKELVPRQREYYGRK